MGSLVRAASATSEKRRSDLQLSRHDPGTLEQPALLELGHAVAVEIIKADDQRPVVYHPAPQTCM